MALNDNSLIGYGWLSVAAAIATIFLKTWAYWLTASVGILSDALESIINLLAAILVVISLKIAAKPPDEEHAFGHEKIEYFSSGAEGVMILFAALGIVVTAVDKLRHPHGLQSIDAGLLLSGIASAINFAVALVLIRAGKKHRSISLIADGKHLLTDVWTTLGIMLAIFMLLLTQTQSSVQKLLAPIGIQDWSFIDPIIAILVAIHILWVGGVLLKQTFAGLMDTALPPEELKLIRTILDRISSSHAVAYHELRTRSAGSKRFVSVHILVPGAWSVQKGHDLIEMIEREIKQQISHVDIDTHLEPLEDSVSWEH